MIEHEAYKTADGKVRLVSKGNRYTVGNEVVLGCSMEQYEAGKVAYEKCGYLHEAFYFLTPFERLFLASGVVMPDFDDAFEEQY